MIEINVIEGARGTFKSTIAFKMRQRIPETTLINFTGFHEDGNNGLIKVTDYYKAWMKFLFNIWNHESKFVFDRFFFTEMIFSQLYKEYDFEKTYNELLGDLELLSTIGVKINIFFLTINDEKELEQRLTRDKVPFGKAMENVLETLRQQELYEDMFKTFFYNNTNRYMNLYDIDTTGKTNEEVYAEIQEILATK